MPPVVEVAAPVQNIKNIDISPAALRDHPLNRQIYGDENDDDFIARVQQDGRILQPVLATASNTLFSGHRRKRAAIACGFKLIPAIIHCDLLDNRDCHHIEAMLLRSNDHRERNNVQIAEEYRCLKLLAETEIQKRKDAVGRSGQGRFSGVTLMPRNGHHTNRSNNDHKPVRRADDFASACLGIGRQKGRQLDAVLQARNQAITEGNLTRAQVIESALNESVHGAWKKFVQPTEEKKPNKPFNDRVIDDTLGNLGRAFDERGTVSQDKGEGYKKCVAMYRDLFDAWSAWKHR